MDSSQSSHLTRNALKRKADLSEPQNALKWPRMVARRACVRASTLPPDSDADSSSCSDSGSSPSVSSDSDISHTAPIARQKRTPPSTVKTRSQASATSAKTAPIMPIKAKMTTKFPAPPAPDEATIKAFGAAQKIDSTPLDAPAPYFKLGECVSFGPRVIDSQTRKREGAIIKAAAWKADIKSYIYKLVSGGLGTTLQHVFAEAFIETSQYGVGDVVKVKAFDTVTRRTIEKIHVSEVGEFTYEIGAGFRARSKDIDGIIARRH